MNYLTELLIKFKLKHKYTQNDLTSLLGLKARNIPKYLSGNLNIRYTLLKRFGIEPNKRKLKTYIKTLLNQTDDIELLCDIYNKLYKETNQNEPNRTNKQI